MVFGAYLLKNAILVLSGVGHLHPVLSPTIGFCMNAQPHRGAFAAFPKKMTNARGDGHAWN